MLRALSLLLLPAVVAAQDPTDRCAEALLRGDLLAANAAVASVGPPSLRARLQAALQPLPQRPAAMLAVAGAFADEADAAILAGAAATLQLLERDEFVPQLRSWVECEDAHDPRPRANQDTPSLAPVVTGFWHLLGERSKDGGDAATLAEARRLLQLCSVSRFGFEPARVLPCTSWPLPKPITEDLRLRAFRRQPGLLAWSQLDFDRTPEIEVRLPVADLPPSLPSLPPGDWLLELASAQTHWRAVRAIEVSDLDVVGLVDHGVLALGAWRAGVPAATAQWQLHAATRELARGQLTAGTVVAWPQTDDHTDGDDEHGAITVQSGGATAWLPRANPWRGWTGRGSQEPHDGWLGHLMLDRPLYRPGDTIQGRVVLRSCRWIGLKLDVEAHTEVARDQPLTLRAFAGTGKEVRCAGRTDDHGVFAFTVPVPAIGADTRGSTFVVEVPGEPALALCDYSACTIASFRRPALLVRATGPAEVRLGGADARVVLHAEWASGGPAADVEVDATATTWSQTERTEQRRLRTDAEGCAVLKIALQHLQPGTVHISFEVEAPDGRREHAEHHLRVRSAVEQEPVPSSFDACERRWLTVQGPEAGIVGEPCRFQVHGPAHDNVLLVAGRGHGARTQLLQLDDHGNATAEVTPTRAEWPSLDVTAASAGLQDSERVPLHLRTPRTPVLELAPHAAPRERLTCKVTTGTPGTVVTVAVVDERIFVLAPDSTHEPNEALRPEAPSPFWERLASGTPQPPEAVLAQLLANGRVPVVRSRSGRAARPTPA